jgi:hypothetical protein
MGAKQTKDAKLDQLTQTKDAKLEQLKQDVYDATLFLVFAKRCHSALDIEKYEILRKEAQEALDAYYILTKHVVKTTGTIQ